MVVIWHRINTFLLVLVLLALVALIGLVATTGEAGPLDPPGAPGTTDGVRQPGTPISSIPFTITEPGNYYVTRNLFATGGDGITVQGTYGVTIDLGGFTLYGSSLGRYGIWMTDPTPGITVRNGTVAGWTSHGLLLKNSQVEDIAATGNQTGIEITTGTVTRCRVFDNTLIGLDASSATVSQCTAARNAAGLRVVNGALSDCSTFNNTNAGIIAEGASVENCSSFADRWGIVVLFGSNVHHNTVVQSGSDGIRVSSAGFGINGTAVIADNVVRLAGVSTPASGIYVETGNNRISRNNVSRGVNAVGINVVSSFNTIDENSTFENSGIGLVVGGTKNTVILNSSTGNVNSGASTNYNIAVGNNAAPVIAAASATNPLSNTQ